MSVDNDVIQRHVTREAVRRARAVARIQLQPFFHGRSA